MTSRAPELPVNHYPGKAIFLWLSGLCLQLAGFITSQGPWLVFGLHTDRQPIGPSSALTACTLFPKLLRGPGTEHPHFLLEKFLR